jgi:hypothetical protein
MTPQQLVICNLDVLEQASLVAEEIDEKVMRSIDNRVAEWANGREGWWADANYDEQWCNFGPKNWPRDQEEDEYKAYFELGTTSERDDDDYCHFLSALTGAVSVEFGIYFSVDAGWMTGLTGRGTRPKAAWQDFLAAQLSERQELHVAGFRQMDGGLFLPIRLAPEDLATAYPDAMDDALQPVDVALTTLIQAYPYIRAFSDHCRSYPQDAK